MSIKEYKPGTTFHGVIGRTVEESSPAWPRPLRARPGSPNVLFIVLDDTGFGQLSCYGGLCNTPHFDRLAENGLLYTNMHTTALCSPTRACILTGRNHHSNHMAGITEISTGYPGYDGLIPFENGFLSEILQQRGYSTFAIGKWHLTPAEQTSAAGPYERWPLGRGFDRYYGFLGGDTHQYYPDLAYDNHRVDPPRTPEQGYHLTEDLVDKAIQFISASKEVAPDKPFFMYFCTGAMHAPHHVPREWADKYKGRFDMGWDKARELIYKSQLELGLLPPGTQLTPMDPDVPRWDSLSEDEKRLSARMMEVFAGFLEHTDHHVGRLLERLERMGELENTLIMLISDNGASPEGGRVGSVNENKFFNFVPESLEENLAALDELGGPKYFNHYPWGWAWAGNTPFRRWKRETYRGGTSDPFIVHWPQGIQAKGEIRTQYAHAIDMVPTVLEALGLEPPERIRGVTQSPIEGVSLLCTFNDAGATSRHTTQYFEMLGHRALYHEGWRAVCAWPGPSFVEGGPFGQRLTKEDLLRLDKEGWQLFHVAEDFSECQDVAEQHRDILIAMITRWYVEAGRYNVLPLDGRGQERFGEERPRLTRERTRYVYYPDTDMVPSTVGVNVLNRPHSITARVEIPKGGVEGVLVAQGGNDGGYCLYMKEGKLHYVHNYVGTGLFHVESQEEVPEGLLELRYEFEPTGRAEVKAGRGTPGRGRLFIQGRQVGEVELPFTTPLMMGLGGGLSVGRDNGSPVSPDYQMPFSFTGRILEVVIDVRGERVEDRESAEREALARQ